MASLLIFDTQEGTVMSPAQSGTHCVPNQKALEKSAHVAQIPLTKTSAKLCGERCCQFRDQAGAVACPFRALLLELNDMQPVFQQVRTCRVSTARRACWRAASISPRS
jgi:hypothetical protein